jgi:predicted O-methyltransferase YrrM
LPENTEPRKGRCTKDGEWRGLGIEFGKMIRIIESDALYREACALQKGRSIMTVQKRMNIFLIMKFFLAKIPFGHIIEFGTYKGGNALFMAHVAKKLHPGVKVYALDTFQGMPETDPSVDWVNKHDFADADLEGLKTIIEKNGLDNLILVQGLFQDIARDVLAQGRDFCFAHIDCDIKSAVSYAYDVVKPAIAKGGYVVFDDPMTSICIGAMEAVEELLYHRDGLYAEQMFPHPVFRLF